MSIEQNTREAPAPETRGWFALFVRRFFPPNFDKWPDDVSATKHVIVTVTEAHFNLKARLMLLLSGRLRIEVMSVWNDHERNARNFSSIEIRPPAFTER